jgi:hypothetical protein
MSKPSSQDVLLANDWPISKVLDCIKKKSKGDLVQFLRVRYEERFLDPIEQLCSMRKKQGYGFAIMALCSLLIETMQCYRYGLPSTNRGELSRLGVPEADWKNGATAFSDFFLRPEHQSLFPNIDGREFYSNIRNGLLHQAQTKEGWKIKTNQAILCDAAERIIDRDKFSRALKEAFAAYMGELDHSVWADDVWSRAVQKISWLVKMSSPAATP